MFSLIPVLFIMVVLQQSQISGAVQDENGQPVGNVEVVLQASDITERSTSDDLGKFRFDVAPGQYTLDFNRTGFFRLSGYVLDAKPGSNEVTVTLNHETEVRSAVDVLSTPYQIVPQQMRHEEEITAREIREDPVPSSHNLQNALPALPQVIQDNAGQLHVSGARVEDTLYALDGFEINNPSTGTFDTRINVDTVREVDMNTGRYGAQFANAATSVLGLQTDTGDDHWRFGITNFLPAFSTQRGIHLGNWFPRVNLSGPLKTGRAWFSDALSVQHDFTLVRELPPGSDISEQWSRDNLLRLQYNLSASQSIHGSFLYNGSHGSRVGLNAFAPAETTVDVRAHSYFWSAKDQMIVNDGLLELGIAADRDETNHVPQGSDRYVLTPTGPKGNYFENQLQDSDRWQAKADAAFFNRHWRGSHAIRFGANFDRTHLDQTSIRQPVNVQQSSVVVRQATFLASGSLSLSEVQVGGYVQDAWQIRSDFIVEASGRIDRNDFIRRWSPQPRLALNWVPGQHAAKLSVGWGLYYQPVRLSLLTPTLDQGRLDVFAALPSDVSLRTSFRVGENLHQPFFDMRSAEWQQQWNERTSSSIHVMERMQHYGLSYEDVSTASLVQDFRLMDRRKDSYRSMEFTLRRRLREGSEVMLNYTYSKSHSNQIFDYSIADLVIAAQSGGPLSWDAPHRVISRGAAQTKLWNLLFSYFAEYHTGFPFSAVNSTYVVVRTPNGYRYPAFFSLNVGAEKRFPFHGRQWAVRLSVINATGHRNFNSVISNVEAPNFLTFAGGQSRAFTARLRLVGRS